MLYAGLWINSPAGPDLPAAFILGWEEWVALPDLGLPAIKAKIDTGARTSALHADLIEPFGDPASLCVRFVVHPRRGHDHPEIVCTAPVVDRREVTSSNGEREMRYVIVTRLSIGDETWPVEVTLTNRESMSYRMLIGRQAIRPDMLVDAATSFRQPKLSFRLYGRAEPAKKLDRSLRLAVVSGKVDAPFIARLADAAQALGHNLDVVDACGVVEFNLGGPMPGLSIDGRLVPHYDAVVPWLAGSGVAAIAVLRQLELMGARSLNTADAVQRLCDPLAVAQALAKRHVPIGDRLLQGPAVAGAVDAVGAHAGCRLRFLVVGGHDVAVVEVSGDRLAPVSRRHHGAERKLAQRAARALRLGLAGVDVDCDPEGSRVAAVSASPELGEFEILAGIDAARLVVEEAEAIVRSP